MKRRRTEVELIEQWRVAFVNGRLPEVAPFLADYGYDDAKMTEGETMFNETQAMYTQNQTETVEAKEANAEFNKAYKGVSQQYSKHRRLAKAVLTENTELWDRYGIVGSISDAYLNWMTDAKKLYNAILTDTERQPLFATVKLSTEEAQSMLTKLTEVEAKRAVYEREWGESQNATKQKDEAFARMNRWMRRFYAVARVALADQPQLLETLMKRVKS